MLAIALGLKAVHASYRVYYTTLADLVARTSRAALGGALADDEMRFWNGPQLLLVIDELTTTQLATLQHKLDQTQTERGRLLDAYQAALLNLDQLTRRTTALTARRDQHAAEHDQLTELATENRLRRGLAGFAERVLGSARRA